MSGGYFNYSQFSLEDIKENIEEIIKNNNSQEKDEYGFYKYYHFSDDTIQKFKIGLYHLKKTQVYIQHIDWLLSGDNGEESFRKRLKEDLKKLDYK